MAKAAPSANAAKKGMTKSQVMTHLAETVGVSKKQAAALVEELVSTAVKNAKNGFMIPGLGKLVLVQRKARMGRNPQTGEPMKIAAKKAVKFRVAKAVKDQLVPPKA